MKLKRSLSWAAIVAAGLGLFTVSPPAAAAGKPPSEPMEVHAQVKPLRGTEVRGLLVFKEAEGGGVRVDGEIQGLAPNSIHGIHIHEKGNCSLPDGSSAGGHFNPLKKTHGKATEAEAHAGDLENIVADASGNAKVEIQQKKALLTTGEDGIVGRSVVIHEKKDDLHSQPAGNSGDRIGCGVIEWAKAAQKSH